MSLNDLTALVPPPAHVYIDRGWPAVTEALRLEFGSDLRAVVDAYGYGVFEPGFTLFDPRRYDCSYVAELLDVMRDPDLHADEYPLPPHPGPGRRLYPVASNGSGGFVMAVVVDALHDESTYWLSDANNGEFTEIGGALSSLLLSLFAKRPDLDAVWHISAPFRPL